jgi:RimJ/RimL family protein N-acetyltransferase
VIHPDQGGRGYATEGVRALLELCFDHAGAHRVTARVDERNAGSARLLERLGFRKEATFVEGEWFKGEWTTLEVFAMLEREWAAARTGQSSRR